MKKDKKWFYYYKFSKVNNEAYIQIWRRDKMAINEYVGTLGKAEKASNILVEHKKLKEQTKIYQEIKTKIQTEEKENRTKQDD